MAALPARSHVALECPLCDEPVQLPLRVGPLHGGAVQLLLDNAPFSAHVAAEHFDVLLLAEGAAANSG